MKSSGLLKIQVAMLVNSVSGKFIVRGITFDNWNTELQVVSGKVGRRATLQCVFPVKNGERGEKERGRARERGEAEPNDCENLVSTHARHNYSLRKWQVTNWQAILRSNSWLESKPVFRRTPTVTHCFHISSSIELSLDVSLTIGRYRILLDGMFLVGMDCFRNGLFISHTLSAAWLHLDDRLMRLIWYRRIWRSLCKAYRPYRSNQASEIRLRARYFNFFLPNDSSNLAAISASQTTTSHYCNSWGF